MKQYTFSEDVFWQTTEF